MSMPHIREARFSEQGQIANVLALAFFDTELFGELIHPHRHKYPADCDLYWLRMCQTYWWDYRHRFMVTTAINEQGQEFITGVAHWGRLGEGGKSMELRWFDPRNLANPISTLYTSISARIWPNRAADPVKEDIIQRSFPFLTDVWTGAHAECWHLEVLAVHPDHQNKGNGRTLVQWGLDQADREGVCASVISGDGKERFYGRCGFDTLVGKAGAGEGNPLADVPGGDILFREAKS